MKQLVWPSNAASSGSPARYLVMFRARMSPSKLATDPALAWLVEVLIVGIDHQDVGGVAVQQAPQPVGQQRPAGTAPSTMTRLRMI